MKSTRVHKNPGFTLVELLVVIVIIASLAALALTLGPRMMAKAKATESMQNIRQIVPLLTTYAADHSMVLPPIQGEVAMPDGSLETLQWNEVCLLLLYPDKQVSDLKNKTWWETNKNLLKNPQFKANTPENPGYAMNEMIAENIDAANAGDLSVKIPLSLIPDPARTPLIAPYNVFHFRFDDGQIGGFKAGVPKSLLSENKLPIVFVDGHLETMTPNEYKERKLSEMPDPDR